MLSDKYRVNDLVEAVKHMTFADLEKAVSREYADLAGSEDPFLNRDLLRHMTIAAQKKFTEQRNDLKAGYGKFLQHLRSFMKDERSLGQFNRHEVGHLLTIFRNIAIAENPRCGRYIMAVMAEMEVHMKSQSLERGLTKLERV